MAVWGEKAALDSLVAEHRARELQDTPAQGDLLGPVGGPDRVRPPDAGRRWGRPNRRTEEAARIYMAAHGDPLQRGIAIAAMPVLAPGVLATLAETLGCNRFDAAKWWAGIYQATLPYVHSRQASLAVRPEGADESDPVEWLFSDGPAGDADDEAEGGLTIEAEAEAIEPEPDEVAAAARL